jgi:hypothetical protein
MYKTSKNLERNSIYKTVLKYAARIGELNIS